MEHAVELSCLLQKEKGWDGWAQPPSRSGSRSRVSDDPEVRSVRAVVGQASEAGVTPSASRGRRPGRCAASWLLAVLRLFLRQLRVTGGFWPHSRQVALASCSPPREGAAGQEAGQALTRTQETGALCPRPAGPWAWDAGLPDPVRSWEGPAGSAALSPSSAGDGSAGRRQGPRGPATGRAIRQQGKGAGPSALVPSSPEVPQLRFSSEIKALSQVPLV